MSHYPVASIFEAIDRSLRPFSMGNTLLANVLHKEDTFEIQVQVPGILKEQIQVEVHGRCVKIAVDATQRVQTGAQPLVMEFTTQDRAQRTFEFREQLDEEQASVQLKDGVLSVFVIPKTRSTRRVLRLDDSTTTS